MKDDKAKHKILPPSKFGLIQITRQRVRPEMAIETLEENPAQNGKVEPPIVLVNKIMDEAQKWSKTHPRLVLTAHPFIAAYLTKGFPSLRTKWFMENKKWIKIHPRDAYTYLEYHFHDQDGKIIQ